MLFRKVVRIFALMPAFAALAACGSQADFTEGRWGFYDPELVGKSSCRSLMDVMIIEGDSIAFLTYLSRDGLLETGREVQRFEGMETEFGNDGAISKQSPEATFKFAEIDQDHITLISGPDVATGVMESHMITGIQPSDLVRCE